MDKKIDSESVMYIMFGIVLSVACICEYARLMKQDVVNKEIAIKAIEKGYIQKYTYGEVIWVKDPNSL
jgi:hypothetical protein